MLMAGLCFKTVRRSITAHYANEACRRQIEKSPLAQIEMSLSTVSVGEHWADDGDYDEPDGDRPDERVAGSGGSQDQDRRGIDVDGTCGHVLCALNLKCSGALLLQLPR
jgi:hypothetical protein